MHSRDEMIVLTGGAGYIGSHTAVSLIEDGYNVIIVDDLSNSSIDSVNGIELITGVTPLFLEIDICDYKALELGLREFNIVGVIHFAAKKSVPDSIIDPILYYTNNITGLINILRLIDKKGIRSFVFSSSCTVYGVPNHVPISENEPVKVSLSPYGNTKKWGEEIIVDFHKALGRMNSVLLRYFNPVGAHESGIIGELPHGVPSNLMPFITQTAIGIRDSLKVFGGDYDTPDGTAIRDYIHVVDLANAHVKSLEYLNNQQLGHLDIFNVGTGEGTSVKEIIEVFQETNKLELNWSIAPRRQGDIPYIWADNSRIIKVLDWEPIFSLRDMVRSSWKWQNELTRRSEK